ncbi:MAG: hypothetical protein GF317_17475 [Candidatus Lokiarchaeota archaeon]|nr:hypothetical protein [Candidatus Lokiarchaeota archaeon]MBD3201312.1 hypothetical protein [Candidatus Lokiarchaeota archaeon]
MRDNNIPKITLVSASTFVKWLTEGIREIYDEYGHIFDFKLYFLNDIESGAVDQSHLIEDLHDSEIILIDIRGNCLTAEIIVETFQKMENKEPDLFQEKTIVSLVGGNSEIRRLTKMGSFLAKKIPASSKTEYGLDEIPDLTDAVRFGQRMTKLMKIAGKIFPFRALKHARNWGIMMDYWVYGLGGIASNHKNMILFLLKNYLNQDEIEVLNPEKIPAYGIYDCNSNKYYDELDEFLTQNPLNPEKQTIGIFFYGGLYFEQSLPIVEKFMDHLGNFNIIPVFSDVLTNIEAHREFFFKDGIKIVSLVINLQYFQLNGGPMGGDGSTTLKLYRELDVPHINPIIQYDNSIEDYINSQEGIIPINQIIAVVMPELDGRFEMITVGCMRDLGYAEEINSKVMEIAPLDNNIRLVSERVKKWLDLRSKFNSEKKIAVIVYNYPPGEDKIGNAAYLDVNESIRNLVIKLEKEGYLISDFPMDKDISDIFLERGAANCPKHTDVKHFKGILLDKQIYISYFENLPLFLRNQIIEYWGEPIGDMMVQNSSIKLPILQFGNVYIGLQPARSQVSGDSNDYHDTNLPPHHQYVAFYKYIHQEIQADAIIHIGTHGTEEFLPGKECAGNYEDYNINLLGNVPNIYYYHVTNTSESAIAKRRANALIINHAGPTFKESELYQEIEQLELLVDQYNSQKLNLPSDNKDDLKSERIKELERDIRDLTQSLNLNYDNMSELEDLLYRYKASVIPMGLHTLGKKYSTEEKKDIISMILLNSAEIPPKFESILEKFGENKENRVKTLEKFLKKSLKIREENPNGAHESIENFMDGFSETFSIDTFELSELFEWIENLDYRMDNSLEMDNIIHALEGGYILPGLGGDPIRSPIIFPTGRNSYGFDPRLIPNTTAYRRGGEIAEKLIENYVNSNGDYPESVSVVLWAFETMKTGGETIGQIFNYLGVRAVKNKSIWTTELEVIPLEEMNHPRINVITTIGGIFRDTFPYLIELINKAVDIVSNLDEPYDKNYLKKSIDELEKTGIENSSARVFGPPPGKYNTNLTNIISAGKWSEETELTNDYLNNMCYAYMKSQKTKREFEGFVQNIKRINLMSQIRDSSEYHITDLDHYYEFTGGLAKSYEKMSGKKANVFIADSSTKNIKVDTLEASIKEGTITRTLNPKWIKGLLNHKYHGGQKVAERVENILGLAATTDKVDNWIWDKAYDQYIENQEINDALKENNKFAMMDIVKNMLQAEMRGYWDATDSQIDNLKKTYLELESWVEKTF